MFDANGVICTDINKASIELFSPEEILRTSVCRIYSTVVFDADGPRKGGLHDPAMGSLDPRIPCSTCGCRRDCPGHLGHIELPLPAFHPTLIPALVRLLRTLCFRCRRLKIDPRTASTFVKKFQFVQNGMLAELEQFDLIHKSVAQSDRGSKKSGGLSRDNASAINAAKRVQLIRMFKKLEDKQRSASTDHSLPVDISESHTAVETWSRIRAEFFKAAMNKSACSHCGRSFKTVIKQAPLGVAIDMSWPFGSEKPFSRQTWSQGRAAAGDIVMPGDSDDASTLKSEDDEYNVTHGKRGRTMGTIQLQAYQLVNVLQSVWKSPDRVLLEFLYPMSIRNGWEMFFIRYLPVSANRFRPLMKALAISDGSGGGTLHNRTSALIDILTVVEKMSFALAVLQHPDPLSALEDSKMAVDPSGVPLPGITESEKSRLRKIIAQHKGNFKLLASYTRELQGAVNGYIDSTKAAQQRGKVPPPGIRQWMERKQGAIRQKMMGKRVNFAARTVIAPDNLINTNEIGIPVEFAKKLTIAEYVTPVSAAYLRQLVENGPHVHPGANLLEDSNGAVYDLSVMSEEQRMARARLLFADVAKGTAPKIVYRHVRDGDVVVMNRQPTLHRASMMAHFVKVLKGWKTFRMMYVNCGSYNADFDGDEMNMHLPQDPCARSEAQLIVNADCHYITAKNGEPLRGLIQDHVLGGAFLTCRDTFLTADQYYTLLYVGMSGFVDRGERLHLLLREDKALRHVAGGGTSGKNVVGDPYLRVLPTENLNIVVEPPTVYKPQRLWTGKQVVTSILKTLIDAIARFMYGKQPGFLEDYKGLNFTSKSKTPGDAWGGVLDGDKEEATLIIRNSELLQGVFDKSMFGASAFGLVHFCFEMLGPSVAGLLLSVFAKTFTCFLQMRGFSCCAGDFLMTPEGEQKRDALIKHCTLAGNYLQEVFVDSVNKQMHWKDELANHHAFKEKYRAAHNAFTAQRATEVSTAQIQCALSTDAVLNARGLPVSRSCSPTPAGVPGTYGIDYVTASSMNSELSPEQLQDVIEWRKDRDTWINGDKEGMKVTEKKGSGGQSDAVNHESLTVTNPWDIARQLNASLPACDWRQLPLDKIVKQAQDLVQELRTLGRTNKRLQRTILESLTLMPELPLYYSRVAKRLGTDRLWGPALKTRLSRETFHTPPCPPRGRIATPTPNRLCVLPSGNVITGDPSLRLPILYHPSWLFENPTGLPFEDTKRYVVQMAAVQNLQELDAYKVAARAKPFSPLPNELTRLRFQLLAHGHFAGREDALIRMMDGFFQSGMGKLTSKNNDLVSGNVTLYKFPLNGFASMITTGAKGSKVNYAMICGMLSQQSLEGKRVPVMVSGKTLPSFARFDLGARAGGLITDRYLTGLQAQEYFFHCMAGREGLVDTAVKTARSGYLQRCVMKGMEGVMVHYDGTVRDSDGTIVQFLYGEDGIDVSKASYANKLEDLLQNPAIVFAKYGAPQKSCHPRVVHSIQQVSRFLKDQKEAIAKAEHQAVQSLTNHIDEQCMAITDPVTNIFPPLGYVGSTSEKYRKRVNALLGAADAHNFISSAVAESRRQRNQPREVPLTKGEIEAAKQRLEHMLLLKFSEMLCDPGEGVGCLSAQSMGEPATQMTLNTFHLAGHGAANVTLGIPRLREILQTAGNAKTPILYIPVRDASPDQAARSAELILHGLKRIPLTDVVHSIGVESNVFHQPENCRKNGLLEYELGQYRDNIDTLLIPKFFWEYEVTIQFENLDHFCKIVPKFTPQKIVALTLSRVVRDMTRQVNKLMYLYATKFAEEELDSEDDELEVAAERFIFDRNIRTQFARRDIRKERARTAGVGFGTKSGGGDHAADLDLMTSADVSTSFQRQPTKDEQKEGMEKGHDDQEETIKEVDANSDAVEDSDTSEDDSEQEFAPSEIGSDAAPNDDEDKDEKDSNEEDPNDPTMTDEDDAEDETAEHAADTQIDDEMKGSGRHSQHRHTVTDMKEEQREAAEETKKQQRRRLRALQSKWRGICLEFDPEQRVLKSDKVLEPEAEVLEAEAMWSDGETTTPWKLKRLPEEAYRFLTDIKVCRKTWRVVLNFGWPRERCPRRISFLDAFVKIVKKYVLQDTPGVRNPRIVAGDSTETGAQYEVQCEGSNFGWIQRLSPTCVDHNRVTSNDIRAVLKFYGVEACRAVIIRELNKVFSVYGITVDYRHMNLIADAMTHSGHFRPFSRLGIRHHSSPFLQMSFETSMKFLTEAVERGAYDDLRTPAGSIVTGKPSLVGSGMCRVLPRIQLSKNMRRQQAVATETGVKAEETPPQTTVKLEDNMEASDVVKKRRKERKHMPGEKKPKFSFGN